MKAFENPNFIGQEKMFKQVKIHIFHFTTDQRIKIIPTYHTLIGKNYYEYYIQYVNTDSCISSTLGSNFLISSCFFAYERFNSYYFSDLYQLTRL